MRIVALLFGLIAIATLSMPTSAQTRCKAGHSCSGTDVCTKTGCLPAGHPRVCPDRTYCEDPGSYCDLRTNRCTKR